MFSDLAFIINKDKRLSLYRLSLLSYFSVGSENGQREEVLLAGHPQNPNISLSDRDSEALQECWMVSFAPPFPTNNLSGSFLSTWAKLTHPGVRFCGGRGGMVGENGSREPAIGRYVCSFPFIMLHETLTWQQPKNVTPDTKWLLEPSPQNFPDSFTFMIFMPAHTQEASTAQPLWSVVFWRTQTSQPSTTRCSLLPWSLPF